MKKYLSSGNKQSDFSSSNVDSASAEIKFYIDQFRNNFGDDFTAKMGKEFGEEAKTSPDLFKFAQDFEINLYLKQLKEKLGEYFNSNDEKEFKDQAIGREDLKKDYEIYLYRGILKRDIGSDFFPDMEKRFMEQAKASQDIFSVAQSLEIGVNIERLKETIGKGLTTDIEQQLKNKFKESKLISKELFDTMKKSISPEEPSVAPRSTSPF